MGMKRILAALLLLTLAALACWPAYQVSLISCRGTGKTTLARTVHNGQNSPNGSLGFATKTMSAKEAWNGFSLLLDAAVQIVLQQAEALSAQWAASYGRQKPRKNG